MFLVWKQEWMNKKFNQTYHANVNVTLTLKKVVQIKFGITINVARSAKIQE